jgi:hypothetical protein
MKKYNEQLAYASCSLYFFMQSICEEKSWTMKWHSRQQAFWQ